MAARAAILKIYFFASSPELKGQLTRNLVGSIGVTCRSKIAKIMPIVNPSWLPFRVCSDDHAQLTGMPYIFFFKIKNCLNDDLFISCDDRIGKCCITSAYLQWLCHSGERPVAHGPLVLCYISGWSGLFYSRWCSREYIHILQTTGKLTCDWFWENQLISACSSDKALFQPNTV